MMLDTRCIPTVFVEIELLGKAVGIMRQLALSFIILPLAPILVYLLFEPPSLLTEMIFILVNITIHLFPWPCLCMIHSQQENLHHSLGAPAQNLLQLSILVCRLYHASFYTG